MEAVVEDVQIAIVATRKRSFDDTFGLINERGDDPICIFALATQCSVLGFSYMQPVLCSHGVMSFSLQSNASLSLDLLLKKTTFFLV